MDSYTFQTFQAFTAATLIYLLLNISLTYVMRFVEREIAVPGFIGPQVAEAAH